MNLKKILKITSIVLLIVTIVLAIITLVNYYKYVNLLDKIQNTENELEKLILREDITIGKYFINICTSLLWTCYTAIITGIISITTYFVSRPKKTPSKIR